MFVIKRDNRKESIKFDKITNRIEKLLTGIEDIDASLITQKICNRIYTGITTTELDILAAEVCMAMVTENPNFGILGSRLAISNHQKNTKESFADTISLLVLKTDIISDNLFRISVKYEKELNNMIQYDRDYLLDYFGFKTLEKAYLLKINNKPVERPQHLFLRVAIGIHGEDLENVKKTYDNISLKNYIHATPTLFNAGTKRNQMASCFLTQVEDSIEGIFETYTDCGLISKWAGGIGCDISDIRAKGSYIRKTGGNSDGLMPLLKTFNSIARQFNQGGKRLGSFAMYLSDWHADIFQFLDAKKNNGAEEERARDLFYALWISDLFMEKVDNDEEWYLMCPDSSINLNNVYGEEFNILYNSYINENKYVKKIKARELWEAIIGSQVEQGVPYILYKDACNKKSNQKNIGTIRSSNLCAEILEYTSKDEVSVCNLASICLPSMLENSYIEYGMNMKWFNLLTEEEKVLYDSKVCYYDAKVKLYSKEDCVYCKLLKNLLIKSGIEYVEIDSVEAEKYRILSEPTILTSKPFETVPQLFSLSVGKIHHLGGYDECWKLLKPRINHSKLYDMAYDLTCNLNKIIDNNFYPIEKTRTSNFRHRPIGIGVQGLADLFIRLKIPFDSEEAMKINKEIFETIYYGAMTSSVDLAVKDGCYSTFDGSPLSNGNFQFNLWDLKDTDLSGRWDWGILRDRVIDVGARNSLLIALMPTASTSQILGSNECFEPVTSNIYTRRTLAGEFTVINKYLIEDLITLDIWNQDTKDRLIYNRGSVKNIKGLPNFMKNIYKTVWEISQKNIIQMSAERAPFVCQTQSLNIFFNKPTFKVLHSAHFTGWKLGLKTGSYYIRSSPAIGSQRFGFDPVKEKELKKEDEDGCLNCSS